MTNTYIQFRGWERKWLINILHYSYKFITPVKKLSPQ